LTISRSRSPGRVSAETVMPALARAQAPGARRPG
jgi:hypothetical protein